MEAIKERTAAYWDRRAAQFSAQRAREWRSDKHLRWLAEFEKYLPADRPLEILDVGTGTGFFALLLAARGHRTTGIDLSGEMIGQARKTAETLGIPAAFFVMDAERPDFPAGRFDALVTRNLTWTLPHLCRAYEAWHSLLRPGGVLINFDGDYCRETQPQTLPENHAHRKIGAELLAEYERIKGALRPLQHPRPAWDTLLLRQAGFRDIRVDTAVWRRIYREQDEFYNPTPIFAISARA